MTNVLYKHEKQFWVEYCLRKIFYKELANIEREALTYWFKGKNVNMKYNYADKQKYNASYIRSISIYV